MLSCFICLADLGVESLSFLNMEGSAEVTAPIENSSEAPHHKWKENDQLPPTDCIALQNSAPVISEETGWTEHLSSLRSPEMLLETLAGKGSHHDLGRHSVSERPTGPCSSSFPGEIMEGLALRNVDSPKVSYTSVCPGSVEDSSIRKGIWHNLSRLAGASRTDSSAKELLRVEDRGNVVGSFMPQSLVKRNLQFTQLSLNHLKAPHNIVKGDSKDLSRRVLARHPTVNSTKVLNASGFQQFLMNSTMKGKGIAFCRQGTDIDTALVTQSQDNAGIDDHKIKTFESLHKPIVKADEMALFGGGVKFADLNVQHEGNNLRDLLKQNNHWSNNFERLQMFKQILELVDTSHSQSFALQHLKPSYFVVLPSGVVKYIGSINTQVQAGISISHQDIALETNLKRKRSMEHYTKFRASLSHKQLKLDCSQELQGTVSPKHQRLCEKNRTIVWHHIYPPRTDLQGSVAEEVYNGNIRMASFDEGFGEQIQLIDSYQNSHIPGCQTICSSSFQGPASGILNLEDRWYASPEELNGNVCLLSSNIYSLGVLFFELFCSFEMEEVHLAAMSNLRHRILPPSFLSECPKEAGFCLWLLHPDPSARPKSREILSSNLIFECNNVSTVDQSSASIDEEDAEAYLLLQFLSSLKDQNENQAAKLVADVQCLEADIEEVERRHLARVESISNANGVLASFSDNSDRHPHEVSTQIGTRPSWSVSSVNEERVMKNIDQLKHAYFSMRSTVKLSETNVATRSDVGVLKNRDNQFQDKAGLKEDESTDRLGAFFEGLCKYARYRKFEVRGCLKNVDILNSANVICSLSFDRDEDYFATAGVSKKIKIFEFGALLNETVDVHYPLIEMSNRSKLSCVSWNNYIKNYLASTDYDGVVQLWDASTGRGFTRYAEHDKRAWSVDFSPLDPTKLASGSDDCSVKLWSIKERNSIDTLRNVANVCCVQFSRHSSHLLACGSADYKIYCYDLRNTRGAWCTLSGHGKAVSYVKFVDSETLVSASTDGTLKLWDLTKSSTSGLSTNACSLTFTGHTNEKNFVGLSVLDGYIACGSETNEVYAYHKALPMPITLHKFGSVDPITGHETGDDENGQFVSSVCWRTKSDMIVAANSCGSLKLLQFV